MMYDDGNVDDDGGLMMVVAIVVMMMVVVVMMIMVVVMVLLTWCPISIQLSPDRHQVLKLDVGQGIVLAFSYLASHNEIAGQVISILTQISRFMWSTPGNTSTLTRSPTFAVLHHDGSVEVFDVQKKSVIKKQTEEKSLTHVGLLTISNIQRLLKGEGTHFLFTQ